MRQHVLLQTSIQLFSFTLALCISLQASAQITSGHIDDFQNMSLNGWTEGGVSPNPPVLIDSGGPSGKDDAFLRNVSSGIADKAGGKWIMFNQSSNWIGNYITAGIGEINMQVRNSGSQNIHLRLAFNGPGGTIASDTVFTIIPDTVWHSIEFVIDPQLFIPLMAGGNSSMTLSAVNEFRILSNPAVSNMGEQIAATVDVDNIRANGLSGVHVVNHALWQIFPNPATDRLQLSRPGYDKPVSIRMTNMAGQILIDRTVYPPYDIDVSEQPNGMYFLQIDDVAVIALRLGL